MNRRVHIGKSLSARRSPQPDAFLTALLAASSVLAMLWQVGCRYPLHHHQGTELITTADPDYKVTVITAIMLQMFVDFPQLRLFKDQAISAVGKAWMRSREMGFDDDLFFAGALSMPGRITIAAAVLGNMAGYPLGCGAPELIADRP